MEYSVPASCGYRGGAVGHKALGANVVTESDDTEPIADEWASSASFLQMVHFTYAEYRTLLFG